MADIKRKKKREVIKISEKNFEQLIKELARVNNWLYYHTWRSIHSPAGFPDCIMVQGKRTIYAELKTEKGKVTEAQQQWLDVLASAGNEVYIWRPSDYEEICDILNYLKMQIKEMDDDNGD